MTTRTGRDRTKGRDQPHQQYIPRYSMVAPESRQIENDYYYYYELEHSLTGDGGLQRNALAGEGSLILFFGDQSTTINLFIHLWAFSCSCST